MSACTTACNSETWVFLWLTGYGFKFLSTIDVQRFLRVFLLFLCFYFLKVFLFSSGQHF